MMQRLWTPWRMQYVSGATRDDSCIFCAKPAMNDDVEQLILHRSPYSFVIMNLYPYNSGHVMVVPFQHAAELTELEPAAHRDLWDLIPQVTSALQRVLRCDGFNIGLNLGSVAGAGVSEHLHIHVVPRWEGDANFMPILASTMVLPELMPVTYAKLRAEFELMATGAHSEDQLTPQAGAIPVLVDRGQIALRRARDHTLVLPKGHIEKGEAAFQTAIRELDEEMGLVGSPAGWAGTLEFDHGGRERRVAYLLVSAEPGTEFERHLGTDTALFAPEAAVAALSHEPARDLLQRLLPAIDRIIEEAQ